MLRLEKALSFAEIDRTLAKELEGLSPFGKGNPTPLFASKGIQVQRLDLIGKNKDILRLNLFEAESGRYLPAISFDGYEQMRNLLRELYPEQDCDTILKSGYPKLRLDMVYTIECNTYQGRSNIQLILKDFRLAE